MTKPKQDTAPRVKDVRLVTDDKIHDAIYIDGKLQMFSPAIFTWEIAACIGTGPASIRHHKVATVYADHWPKRFDKLTLLD